MESQQIGYWNLLLSYTMISKCKGGRRAGSKVRSYLYEARTPLYREFSTGVGMR